ncbi:MAG: hypothetical protein RUMPE_00345 [Eubacteriales bacterium SKADARSKE-1]|nr:hypothetical protein [Eubacteriales bacterium SKADARSKE-1]
MQDIKLDGISKINGGEYATVAVNGIAQINGHLKSKSFSIDGKCKINGDTTTSELFCNGITEIEGKLKATDIKVDGILTVNGDHIETQTLVCDGTIRAKNLINSEILDANGIINAMQVNGNKVIIKSHSGKFIKLFLPPASKINKIKADNIELSGVKSQKIVGQDIIIGPCCEIEDIECSGTLKVNKRATVNNIIGDYSLIN